MNLTGVLILFLAVSRITTCSSNAGSDLKKAVIVLVLSLLFETHARDTNKNIILLVLAGVRNKDSIAGAGKNIFKSLHENLLKQGTLYSNVRDNNFQFHIPSLCSILTGVNYRIFAKGDLKLREVSILQYARKQLNLAANQTWAIGHWEPYQHGNNLDYGKETYPIELCSQNETLRVTYNRFHSEIEKALSVESVKFIREYLKSPAMQKVYWPLWNSWGAVLNDFTFEILNSCKPRILVINMQEPETAHFGSWAHYVHALRKMDEHINQLFEYINNDPHYKDRTYLIITPDHTRDSWYGQHYNFNYSYDAPVWMYIFGPRVKKNLIIDREANHIDLFPTMAKFLNLKVHKSPGTLLNDCINSN